MPPKHGGGGGAGGVGATIKGKQASVHEGHFLQFLRSVGYRGELPPSTVAWLESAPVFRFLASKLSHDNFVSPEEEQEYNELMLARGPDVSLYDAVDGLGSDVDSDSGVTATTSTRAAQRESDLFLADMPDEEVARMLEVRVCSDAQEVEATSGKTAAIPHLASIPRTHTHTYTHLLTYHVCIISTGRGGIRTCTGAAGVCPARSIRRPGLHDPAAGRDPGRAAFRPHSNSRCGDSVLHMRTCFLCSTAHSPPPSRLVCLSCKNRT